jgi:hypothetical protein
MPRRASQHDPKFSPADRRAAIAAHAGDRPDDEQRPCARGDWCTSDDTITRWEDGKRAVTPARGPRTFCETDRAEIRDALASFPRKWDQLHAELRKLSTGGQQHRGKASAPPLEYRADVDALMRLLADIAISWNDRVGQTPGTGVDVFPDLDAETRFRCGYRIVAEAARQLRPRLDTLLGLPPGWMVRVIPAWLDDDQLARWPDAEVVAADASGPVVRTRLDGAAAGLEILHLDYRCRSVLGETDPKPESLDGVRCYNCHRMSLRRADPPQKADDPEWYSQCRRAVCSHKMTEPDYRTHVARLAATARGRTTTPCLDLRGLHAL